MKKVSKFFDKYSDTIIGACLITAVVAFITIVIISTVQICNLKTQQNFEAYDVIAATDETYVLQNCNDTEHYIEVDQSEMYGVGDTVLVSYTDEKINSIWLYINC